MQKITSGVLAFALGAQLAVAAADGWQAGFARVDLEPPKGLSLAGYFEDRPCTGVKDPVEATCVALGTAKGTALLYTLDLVELKGVAPEWKKAIAAATGLKPEAVVLACTHTHTAPSVGPAAAAYEISVDGSREYDDAVLRKLIAAGKAALADRAPAVMRQVRTEARGLSFVRRYRMKDGTVRTNPGAGRLANVEGPVGTPDESVQIVRLDRGAGKPALALVNFQCHADMIGGTEASADWPGFARRALERDLGVKAAVYNGALGDTNHLNLRDFRHGYEACRRFGEKLAASVRAVWDEATDVAPAPLAATYQPVEVTLRTPSRAERAATNKLTKVARNRVAKLAAAPHRLRIPVTHIRFGDAFALCGYPCEPFTEIGRDTKRRVTAKMTFVTSLTDGSYGYLPTADGYDEGAYETDSSIFAPGTDRLMTMAVALAGRLPAGQPQVVKVEGIPNMRDLGGWTGLDGRRVRTGRIFRSAGLNNNASHKIVTNDVGEVVTNHTAGACRLDAKGRFAVTNTLGIRTDIDLRTPPEVWGMTGSPAGPNVVWTNFSSGAYGNILTDWGRKAFAEEFKIFLDERNYPIVFHCIAGADRTGTLAYVLNALLGVREDDLDADYAYTTVTWGLQSRQNFLGNLFPKLNRTFDSFSGKTVHERVASFVKAQGFTDADIERFRNLMLEIPGCPEAPPSMNLVGRSDWDSKFHLIRSSADGTEQPLYAVFPKTEKPVPLLVGLHSWSMSCHASIPAVGMRTFCEANGWAFVYPNCRGPNNRPEACGSPLVLSDMMDAIAWAKTQCPIDADRIYLIGSSGGGYLTLLAAAKHPEVFAAVAAFCPITDLVRWHAESLARHHGYYRMMEASCGGTPAERLSEYVARSPVWFLPNARGTGPVVYIATGIHDGHNGNSVPVGHSIRAFNALARPEDRYTEAEIAAIEASESVPRGLGYTGVDPLYPTDRTVHLRRTSDRVRLTLFEGGHQTVAEAAYDFVRRQRRGAAADWTLPDRAAAPVGTAEQITR